MATSPYSTLNPSDAAVAMRSVPRRVRDAARAAVLTLDDEPDPREVNEVANRPGADGRSAVDLVAGVAQLFDRIDRSLASALVSPTTTIDQDLLEPDLPQAVTHSGDLDHELAELERGATTLAERIEHADPNRWLDPSPTSSGGTATPLDLVRSAVAVAVAQIGNVDRVLREVRGRR